MAACWVKGLGVLPGDMGQSEGNAVSRTSRMGREVEMGVGEIVTVPCSATSPECRREYPLSDGGVMNGKVEVVPRQYGPHVVPEVKLFGKDKTQKQMAAQEDANGKFRFYEGFVLGRVRVPMSEERLERRPKAQKVYVVGKACKWTGATMEAKTKAPA
jgi:hypothetical protein